MGIIDDLAMGFGMKPRTEDYDARTARGVAINKAVGNAPQQMAGMITSKLNAGGTISPSSSMYKYLDKSAFSGHDGSGGYSGAQLFTSAPVESTKVTPYSKYFTDRGYEQGYIPQMGSDKLSGDKPYAIGPFTSDKPMTIPTTFSILQKILGGAFGKQNQGAPLPSGAIAALEGGTLKAPSQMATQPDKPQGIITAAEALDGQITDEELADVTETPENEFAGMSNNEIARTLISRYNSDNVPPMETYSYLFENDPTYSNYLKTKPVSDQALAIALRIAGR